MVITNGRQESRWTCALGSFTETFKVTNHNILIAKFTCCGFLPLALAWMRSYLSGRTVVVFPTVKIYPAVYHKGLAWGHIYSVKLFTIVAKKAVSYVY